MSEEDKTQQIVSEQQDEFLTPNITKISNGGNNETLIVRSREDVSKLMDSMKLMTGMKTNE